jgi:hypothetical protein
MVRKREEEEEDKTVERENSKKQQQQQQRGRKKKKSFSVSFLLIFCILSFASIDQQLFLAFRKKEGKTGYIQCV